MILALLGMVATEAVTLGWRLTPHVVRDIVIDGIYAAGDDAFSDASEAKRLRATLARVKIELRGTTAQGGDAECLIDQALADTVQGHRRHFGSYRYPSNKYAPEGTPL